MSRKVSKNTILALASLLTLASLLSASCGSLSPEQIDAQAEEIAVPLIATWQAGAPMPTVRPTGTPIPTNTPTPSSDAATTRTSLPAEADLAASQELNLAVCCSGTDFAAIDPALLRWDGPPSQIIMEAFVGLTRQNEETSDIEPGMATSWDVSTSSKVWTFKLRTDVPWVRYNAATDLVEQVTDDSGEVRTVSAYDFEYGIMRVLNPDTDSGYLDNTLYLIEGAENFAEGDGLPDAVGIQALDAETLEIRLNEPAGYFDVVVDTWRMVAQPAWQIKAQGDEWTETGNFQGYGPYVLKEWEHESHLTLVKNPHWPGTESVPQPTVEEITWTIIDDADDLMAMYEAGDLDVIQLPQDMLATAQADPQLANQLVAQPNLCTYYYGFNTEKPPFDDPKVRLAFSLAVDRQALIDDVLQVDEEPARWFSPPGARAAPTAEESPALEVTYEPDQAAGLLDQVYPDRSVMPPVTLAFSSIGQHELIAEAIQGMWADVLGVEVELESIQDFGDYLDLLKTDAPQVYRMGWCQYYPDTHCFLSYLFHSTSDYASYTNWSSNAFDALVDQAAASTDVAKRAEWYAQAEDILNHEDAVIIPIYWYANSALTQPTIHRTYSQLPGMERFEKWAVLER